MYQLSSDDGSISLKIPDRREMAVLKVLKHRNNVHERALPGLLDDAFAPGEVKKIVESLERLKLLVRDDGCRYCKNSGLIEITNRGITIFDGIETLRYLGLLTD